MSTAFVRGRGALCAGLISLVVGAATAQAELVSVADHSLSDWGLSFSSSDTLVTPGLTTQHNVSSGSDKNNTSPSYTQGGFTYWYNYEDTDDSAGNNVNVGPHTGGQNYDGEFLGAGFYTDADGNQYLAIAIVTGQRPDNGTQYYSPGDIRINTLFGETYGVETTGKTYTLDSSGNTTSSKTSQYAAGTVVQASDDNSWVLPPFSPYTPVQLNNTTYKSGKQTLAGNNAAVGSAELYSSGNSLTYSVTERKRVNGQWKNVTTQYKSQHAFYEVLIPLSYFGGAPVTSVHWAPSCGNDLLDVNLGNGVVPTGSNAPEPGSAVLALMAGLGVWRIRRRKTEPKKAE